MHIFADTTSVWVIFDFIGIPGSDHILNVRQQIMNFNDRSSSIEAHKEFGAKIFSPQSGVKRNQ